MLSVRARERRMTVHDESSAIFETIRSRSFHSRMHKSHGVTLLLCVEFVQSISQSLHCICLLADCWSLRCNCLNKNILICMLCSRCDTQILKGVAFVEASKTLIPQTKATTKLTSAIRQQSQILQGQEKPNSKEKKMKVNVFEWPFSDCVFFNHNYQQQRVFCFQLIFLIINFKETDLN